MDKRAFQPGQRVTWHAAGEGEVIAQEGQAVRVRLRDWKKMVGEDGRYVRAPYEPGDGSAPGVLLIDVGSVRAAETGPAFPLASEILRPVRRFLIGGRWASLYFHTSRMPSCAYSLYFDDERNPMQHGMSDREVFEVLAHLLNGEGNRG